MTAPSCPTCQSPLPAALLRKIRRGEGAPKVGRPRSKDRCACGRWTKSYAAKKYHHCEEKKR